MSNRNMTDEELNRLYPGAITTKTICPDSITYTEGRICIGHSGEKRIGFGTEVRLNGTVLPRVTKVSLNLVTDEVITVEIDELNPEVWTEESEQ